MRAQALGSSGDGVVTKDWVCSCEPCVCCVQEGFALIPSDVKESQEAPVNQLGDKVMVVRLQPDVVDYLLKTCTDSKEVLLTWQVKPCELNIVTAGGSSNQVVARCQLVRVDALHTLFELRQEAQFASAPPQVKASWREVVARRRKPIYKWTVEGVTVPIQRIHVPPGRGTWSLVPSSQLIESTATLPGMSLESTAKYFIGRLDTEDYDRLADTARFLHGKTIRIGTTCSGTDGCLNVVRATLDVLKREFKASLAACNFAVVSHVCVCVCACVELLCFATTCSRWIFICDTASVQKLMLPSESLFWTHMCRRTKSLRSICSRMFQHSPLARASARHATRSTQAHRISTCSLQASVANPSAAATARDRSSPLVMKQAREAAGLPI